ncbi:Aminoglycoside phosphotransferase [Penicillium samsonianum]|uniref:Aminoglycoside phosphotransferase n=1 Tax=Penicillium samsonianum TaxID=1882272 RepID=UPI00254785E0|nr:Aminoglycoside phosphotransferase [Penicillium samsonianum]KAJ6143139.1 Aminoglycoside phosphotransferase [Penicillium samsonianum]
MEYLYTQTLEQAWDRLESNYRVSICYKLRTIYNNIRQLEQELTDSFIGIFTFLYQKPTPDPYSIPIEPFRHNWPNDSEIKFTYSDLHRSNILITRSEPYHVLTLIDWEQSGHDEWSKKYLPMILCQFTSTWDPWNYYTMAMECQDKGDRRYITEVF